MKNIVTIWVFRISEFFCYLKLLLYPYCVRLLHVTSLWIIVCQRFSFTIRVAFYNFSQLWFKLFASHSICYLHSPEKYLIPRGMLYKYIEYFLITGWYCLVELAMVCVDVIPDIHFGPSRWRN